MNYNNIDFEDLNLFLDAANRKNATKRFMWLYENDSVTSADISKEHPELNNDIHEIKRLFDSCLPVFEKIKPLMRKVKRYSPKF